MRGAGKCTPTGRVIGGFFEEGGVAFLRAQVEEIVGSDWDSERTKRRACAVAIRKNILFVVMLGVVAFETPFFEIGYQELRG